MIEKISNTTLSGSPLHRGRDGLVIFPKTKTNFSSPCVRGS